MKLYNVCFITSSMTLNGEISVRVLSFYLCHGDISLCQKEGGEVRNTYQKKIGKNVHSNGETIMTHQLVNDRQCAWHMISHKQLQQA